MITRHFFRPVAAVAVLLCSIPVLADEAGAVDPALPDYAKTSGVSGNINSVGSDTLANLMTFWAEEFKKQYPNVNVQIQAAGSSTAPPALTEGTSNFGPMSREMKAEEVAAFESRYGYKPTGIAVAIDALAVFVHKDNPVQCLSLPQVDAIFSATRKCGHNEDITKWNQAGATADFGGQSMQLYGRNSVSGTYGFFKDNALCKGDYKNTVNEQPGSASVVQSVTKSPNGIGYSGIGYKTSGVKPLALSKTDGGECVPATPENALSGKYPLSRFLFVYVNKNPSKPLPPLETEFIKMVLSRVGQSVVLKDGFIPLPAKVAGEQMAKIGGGGAAGN